MDKNTRLNFIKSRNIKIKSGVLRQCNVGQYCNTQKFQLLMPALARVIQPSYRDILDELTQLPAFSAQDNNIDT